MFIKEEVQPQDINLTSVVKIKVTEGQGATAVIPKEIRLTQYLVGLLQEAVKAQGFELRHMEITEDHIDELGALSNVVLREQNPAGQG